MTGRAVVFVAALLVSSLLQAQIRIERDANGHILITNKDRASASRKNAKRKAPPLPAIPTKELAETKAKLRTACSKRGLDYGLVASLVRAESNFRPNVLSRRGAVGLMQLMPKTAKRFGCTNRWDIDQNIRCGTALLAHLFDVFGQNIPLVLAAYNAGENAVKKYGKRIPPYGETVRYVFTILDYYGHPRLVKEAKSLLVSPYDYERFYLSRRNRTVSMRVYYLHIDSKGHPHIYDYPPAHIDTTPIVYKDD